MAEQRDFSKLPQWAQRHIQNMERENISLQRALEEGPTESDTFAILGISDRKPLGIGTEIEYQFGNRNYINVRSNGGGLTVMGSHVLVVYPRASNHVGIALEKR